MTEPVIFTVAGEPRGKGRARAFRRGNFIGHYTPEATRSYEGMIRFAAQEAMAGRLPFDTAVEIEVAAFFAIPKSFSKAKRAAAICGEIRPAKKPDADNIIKAVTDACNAVIYADDALIVAGRFGKFYGPAACVVVRVKPAAIATDLAA